MLLKRNSTQNGVIVGRYLPYEQSVNLGSILPYDLPSLPGIIFDQSVVNLLCPHPKEKQQHASIYIRK